MKVIIFACMLTVVFITNFARANDDSGIIIIPVIKVPSGDATAEDVLTGKSFSNANATGINGTMPDNGAVHLIPGTTLEPIPAGYHNGSGSVAGDTDLVASNIQSGVEIFGVIGSNSWKPDCSSGTLNGTRWCDNGDGSVTDLTTGLIWMKNASWGLRYPFWGNSLSVTNAHDRAAVVKNGTPPTLTDGSGEGYWRLPTLSELTHLANGVEQVRSDTPRAFSGVQADNYWSSTTLSSPAAHMAWYVELDSGAVNSGYKANYNYVWPVRSAR